MQLNQTRETNLQNYNTIHAQLYTGKPETVPMAHIPMYKSKTH